MAMKSLKVETFNNNLHSVWRGWKLLFQIWLPISLFAHTSNGEHMSVLFTSPQ